MKSILRRVAISTTAVLVVALVGLMGFIPASADPPPTTRPFAKVFGQNANGAIVAIGNSLLSCPSTVGVCPNARAGAVYDNNDFRMVDIDQDTDAATYNSSSSELNLPTGATVLFAGLYWGARLDKGTTSGSATTRAGNAAKAGTIKFKLPNESAYLDLTGEVIAQNSGQKNAYQSYLEVTDLVTKGGNGYYWGANVESGTGLDRYAGWSLVVAYSAPGLPLRNLTVYQGFQTVGLNYPSNITLTDFLAPKTGPVDVQLSMVAYEGDLAQTGDFTRLTSTGPGGTPVKDTQLATPMSPGSNFFDSVNSLAGASVATRDPNYKNMLGFDIKNLDASGTIPNSATSAQFSFRSAGDVYYPGVLALAINLYAPDFTSSTKNVVNVSSPRQPANPGDTLQYTVMFANTGQDHAINAVGCDTMPPGVEYLPGSLWLLGTPDDKVDTPVNLKDDGTSFAKYDAATRELCINLGTDAEAYNSGGGGRLNVLDATVFQFRAIVNEDAGGTTVRNTAHLAYTTDTEKLDAVYDPPAALIDVGLKADVKITKEMDPKPAIAGQTGVTTLTVTNDGPSRATGVKVTDPLPTDYTATGVTWRLENPTPSTGGSGTCATPTPGENATVTCDLPDLALHQRAVVEIQGAPNSDSTAASLSNIASVTTTSFDPDLTNNVDTLSIPMTHQADLKIEKTPTPQSVTPGAEVTWTLTVTNKCDPNDKSKCLSDATGVVITDTVADSSKLSLTSASDGGGDVAVTCPGAQGLPTAVQCTVNSPDGRLKPGETAKVTVTGFIPANVLSGTVINNAAVTSGTFDPNQGDNITEARVTPSAPLSDIQLTKTGTVNATPGGRVDYTIKAINWGPSDATAVQITDDLPAALSVDGSTKVTTSRGTCAIVGKKVTCDIPTLPGPDSPGQAGGDVTINITGALLNPAQTTAFTNTAKITCGGSACPEPPSPKPDQPSWPTGVTPSADLAVTKTASINGSPPGTTVPGVGDTVLYEITVVNNGPSNARSVTLTDVLPPGLTATAIVGASCNLSWLSCSLGDLDPGDSVEVVVRTNATSTVPDPAVQTATVASPTSDPNEDNNVAKWTHSGGPTPADLAITKSSNGIEAGVTGDPAGSGANVYTLTVRNLGPATAHNVVVTDTLPDRLTFVASNPTGCAVDSQDPQKVTCTLASMDPFPGSTGTQTWKIAVKANSDLPQSTVLTNTATVTADEPDPSEVNNTATVTDVVSADADVQLDYAIGYGVAEVPDPADPNKTIYVAITDPNDWRLTQPVYTGPGSLRYALVHVINNGPADALNVRGTSNVAINAIPNKGQLPDGCTTVNQQVVCNMPVADGRLMAGAQFWFAIPFSISPSESEGDYPDCDRENPCGDGHIPGGFAEVSTSTHDRDLTNNYDTGALKIGAPGTDLNIKKTALSTFTDPDGHEAYIAGEKFGYRIDLWVPATEDASEQLDRLLADATNVVLTDDLPDGFTPTQVNTGQGTCDPIDPDNPPTGIRCDIGTIAASTDSKNRHIVSVYVYGSIDPDTTAEISQGKGAKNTATVTSDTPPVDPAHPTPRTDTPEVDVVQRADLAVTKLADDDISYTGSNVGYTITTVNNGPSEATNTTLTDTLPAGLTLDGTLSPTCKVTSGSFETGYVIVCAVGDLLPNSSANTRIVTTTDPRDLRPYWCPGQDPETDPVETCDEVLPPEKLY
ncbi:MAG: DUF11 domain-containing protein, partial [Bifidobacteriaceae bacterium]|nr:DUF11 domain-containing protein [Bifidobacteriaceae bacterium]